MLLSSALPKILLDRSSYVWLTGWSFNLIKEELFAVLQVD